MTALLRLMNDCRTCEGAMSFECAMPYNILIAANGSPINRKTFDQPLEGILNTMLRSQNWIELAKAVLRLPSKH